MSVAHALSKRQRAVSTGLSLLHLAGPFLRLLSFAIMQFVRVSIGTHNNSFRRLTPFKVNSQC